MSTTNLKYNRVLRELLIADSIAYLLAGTFLILSHELSNAITLRYIGYLLLATSIIILFSLIRTKWANRVIILDSLFNVVLFIVTFASLYFYILGELIYYHQDNQFSLGYLSSIDSTIAMVLLVSYLWVFIYAVITVKAFFKTRLRGIRHLMSMAGTSRLLVFCIIVFVLSGIFSIFTKEFAYENFWDIGLFLSCIYGAFQLRSPTFRETMLRGQRFILNLSIFLIICAIIYISTLAFDIKYYYSLAVSMLCLLIIFWK